MYNNLIKIHYSFARVAEYVMASIFEETCFIKNNPRVTKAWICQSVPQSVPQNTRCSLGNSGLRACIANQTMNNQQCLNSWIFRPHHSYMYSNRSAIEDGPSADLHAYQQSYKTVTHKSQDIQIYDASCIHEI